MAGSALMGLARPGALEFAGTVGSGLSVAELRELTALLEAVEQPVSPFAGPLPVAVTRQARWARPVLAAEVTYLERTPSWLVMSAGLAGPEAGLAASSCPSQTLALTGVTARRRTTVSLSRWSSGAARAHAVVVSVLTPAEVLIAARRLAGARPHLAAVAGIVHREDLWLGRAAMSSELTFAWTAGISEAAGSAWSSGPRRGSGSCVAAR